MSRKDFNTDSEYKRQLVKELIEIVGELGWQVAIPDTDDDEEVPGLIVGEPEYVNEILDRLEDEGIAL